MTGGSRGSVSRIRWDIANQRMKCLAVAKSDFGERPTDRAARAGADAGA
jgi:hypothetical protein